MQLQIIVVAISFILAALGVTGMYNGVYIPSVKLILLSGLTAIAIHLIVCRIRPNKNKKLDKLMGFAMTLFGVMLLSSFVYSSWKMEKFLSHLAMMKLTLVLLVVVAVYLNIVFIRAEISYKKKRGNQRIEEQPNKSYFEKRKEEKKRIERGEVRIILGGSTDNDDN
ncbi:hypothetical protein CSV80_11205 [Sporosarcina sp. P12(2017)]|uniref:hypothetical protein n=1 Tax=unclassified Sporosarcina TaxID=2647733 RepID=UPI000C1634F8|nr:MULTISPECIES: hypothetical protein [unclassified Sporosarcina]PIC57027.1 hypothetical protein CSV81_11605 [Sporosarcina sp. P10]PIC60410.1 hypothetical protein CSV80_11205 [Sporosarcina sp. P12(2017)]